MAPIRLFTGFDQREAAGWHVFVQSVIDHASRWVTITPLEHQQRDGSNAFTYARFLVPHLCNYEGFAIYADGADMLVLADIAKLWELREERYAVQVVKHDYKTKFPRKYLGTPMECANEDYPRKNWSSVMIWNCAHQANVFMTPDRAHNASGAWLHRFQWLPDELIGNLPTSWNWLADEYGTNQHAKLLHFTAGIPAIAKHRSAPGAQAWFETEARVHESP